MALVTENNHKIEANNNNDCNEEDSLPIIDISPLFGTDDAARGRVAEALRAACREHGFFYAKGHGISPQLILDINAVCRQFFALPLQEKMEISIDKFGRGGKGYFPMLAEKTSEKPDVKEGIYFGVELEEDHPMVQAGYPLHGPNPFPMNPKEMRQVVLQYMEEAGRAAQALMEGIALSLGLDSQYFRRLYTEEPTVIMGILHYPSQPLREGDLDDIWGTGEHTDYGLLTLLLQDDVGGLQVKSHDHWIEGIPMSGALICNIGDMLDLLTGGFYKSTLHRVKVNRTGRNRLSLPLFFDPGFDREVVPLPDEVNLPRVNADDDKKSRWDGRNLHQFRGPYGDYYLGKVAKAFPNLGKDSSVCNTGPRY